MVKREIKNGNGNVGHHSVGGFCFLGFTLSASAFVSKIACLALHTNIHTPVTDSNLVGILLICIHIVIKFFIHSIWSGVNSFNKMPWSLLRVQNTGHNFPSHFCLLSGHAKLPARDISLRLFHSSHTLFVKSAVFFLFHAFDQNFAQISFFFKLLAKILNNWFFLCAPRKNSRCTEKNSRGTNNSFVATVLFLIWLFEMELRKQVNRPEPVLSSASKTNERDAFSEGLPLEDDHLGSGHLRYPEKRGY